nr:PREDICTED: protein PET100 homolog, mitochondrial [Bemisia tabaci]
MTKDWKWQLEIFRMFTYIMFPVGTFYAFNQPEFFEGWVKEMYSKHLPSKEQEEIDRELLKRAARNRNLSLLEKKLSETK